MQTINQLNETIRILQTNTAAKDARIKALELELNDPSNVSLVIVVPSTDEQDNHPGKVG